MTAPTPISIVGVDCATQPRSVGLALLEVDADGARLLECVSPREWDEIDERVAAWIGGRSLVAIDAPLGWPRLLGPELARHRAGAPLEPSADMLFRRATDDVVAAEIGKRSLDVGADRIARTARAALGFLERLRQRTKRPIPLAWRSGHVDDVAALEVYPAATLAGRGWPSKGYKKTEARAARATLAEKLGGLVAVGAREADQLAASDHLLDAALCGLAALDFARGEVIEPTEIERARVEGWIWVRPAGLK